MVGRSWAWGIGAKLRTGGEEDKEFYPFGGDREVRRNPIE